MNNVAHVEVHGRTFASLAANEANVVRAILHHPVPLDVRTDAVRVSIDGGPLGEVAAVEKEEAGLNFFNIWLEAPVPDGAAIALVFDATLIEETVIPRITLSERLRDAGVAFLDREGDDLLAFTFFRAGEAGPGVGPEEAGGDLRGSYPNPKVKGIQGIAVSETIPTPDDVLTFVRRDEIDEWCPMPLPALPPIASVTPESGQVLFWTGSEWRPGPAGGDLAGAYPDPTVVGLQGRRIVSVPTESGQGLVWTGSDWRPDFTVGAEDAYSIVAAGRFFATDGKPSGPAINGLKVTAVEKTSPNLDYVDYTLSFDTYGRYPSSDYIVKGAFLHSTITAAFQVLEFKSAEFVVRLSAVADATITDGHFMIEVSKIGHLE